MKLDDVAQELYALPPERFTEMRNTRAKEIAAAGDRELAGEVRRLPKPTVAAWLANMLVRTHAATVEQLVALGSEHRDAQGRGRAEDMRRVAERRRELIRQLVGSASRSAVDAGHSMGSHVQRQLEETLEAAVADDESAAMLRTGRLSSPMVFIGFGRDEHDGEGFCAVTEAQESVVPTRCHRRGAPGCDQGARCGGSIPVGREGSIGVGHRGGGGSSATPR